jgi:hypothetical protein
VNPTPRRGTVYEGPEDPSLTHHAGLLLVGELVHRTRLIEHLDAAIDGIRPFKLRRRGLSGGELLVSLAESMLAGGDHLVHLDVLRQDRAGEQLRAIAKPPAPTTAGQLLNRLDPQQRQAAVAALAEVGNQIDRHLGLPVGAPVTLDLDSTATEVYGRQELAGFNYLGQRNCSSLLVTWAQRRRVLAADLRSGSASDKPAAPAILLRALKTLPAGHGSVHARADSGFYSLGFMETCRRKGVSFSVSMPRTTTTWEARRHTGPHSWRPALQMRDAEIAEVDYRPSGWKHETLRLIIRRTKIPASELSQSPRSRRRRTVPKGQLRLALRGRREYVYGYSFVLTDRLGDAAEIELEHRQRAQIEERVKDVKLGCGLRHLPLFSARANRGWQTAAVIATNLASMLSAEVAAANHRVLAELAEDAEEQGDLARPPARRVARHNSPLLRRWLIDVPGRLVRGGRRLYLRLAAGMTWRPVFWATYHRLRLLTSSA